MEKIINYFFIFTIGLCIGSFYNVIIYNVPLDIPIFKGRISCTNCYNKSKIIDLIPLLRFLFFHEKCRYCNSKILKIHFFIVEFLTSVLIIMSFNIYGYSFANINNFIFWSMLLVVSIMDYNEGYIYTKVLILFLTPSILIQILALDKNILKILTSSTVGFLIYYIIYFITKKIYKKEVFGLGDVYLMASIGSFIEIQSTILVAFSSFVVALFFIILSIIFGKIIRPSQEIPFGPYMCICAFIVSLYGDKIIQLYIDFLFS